MKNRKTEFLFVHDKLELTSFLKTLPIGIQLRYLSHTALNGRQAVSFIVPHKDQKNYYLITPYNLSGSSTSKVETYKKQKLSEIIKKGLSKETFKCLKAEDWQLLGTLTVPDSVSNLNEPHAKHIEWIKDYEVDKWQFGQRLEGDLVPIWLHIDLFPQIFEEMVNIGGRFKEHPKE